MTREELIESCKKEIVSSSIDLLKDEVFGNQYSKGFQQIYAETLRSLNQGFRMEIIINELNTKFQFYQKASSLLTEYQYSITGARETSALYQGCLTACGVILHDLGVEDVGL